MKRFLLTLPLLLFIILFSAKDSHAQFDNVGEILRGGANDANLLLENYITPFANGFGADLNTGWSNSARPYRTLGFDIRVNAAAAFVPSSDEFFDVADLEPRFDQLELFSSGITPTVSGTDDGPTARLGQTYTNPMTGQEEELFSFDMPRGTGISFVPAPMVQATVGVIRSTDVTLRVLPTITLPETDGGQFNMFGLGVKHGLNQYIPGGRVLPVDLSAQIGFTRINFDVPVTVNPEENGDIRNDFDESNWEGQNVGMAANAYTVNLLVGRNLPILSVFAGVGFQSSTTSLKAEGAFPITVPNEDFDGFTDTRTRAIDEIVNPVDMDIDGANSVHALAGFRVRLGFLAVSGSYTVSKYPVANVGVGLSFR